MVKLIRRWIALPFGAVGLAFLCVAQVLGGESFIDDEQRPHH